MDSGISGTVTDASIGEMTSLEVSWWASGLRKCDDRQGKRTSNVEPDKDALRH